MSKRLALWLLVLMGVFTSNPTTAFAEFMYNEDVSGDFSGMGFFPTVLPNAGVGANTVTGRTSRDMDGFVDRDYFTFTVPVGLQLDSVVMTSYTGDGVSFIGFQQGTVLAFDDGMGGLTDDPDFADPAQLLGWAHMGTLFYVVGQDLLPDMLSQGGMPATMPPLPADTYTFWIQETGPTEAKYTVTFNVSAAIAAVPEPSSLCLACLGALSGLTYAARRRAARSAA
jgi:hypothetical protein